MEAANAIGYRHATIGFMDKTFGALVRERREALDMKSYELAEKIGRRPSLISRIENGDYKETPPPDIIAGLAEALRMPQYRLLQALGYDVGPAPSEEGIDADPVLAELIADLRRLPLTGERPTTFRRLIDVFSENDRLAVDRSRQEHKNGGDNTRVD